MLPRGKQALSPSNWRFQEAPFYLEFAVDIDGDGNDEVLGYDLGTMKCLAMISDGVVGGFIVAR